jgi:hypothetical protein
LVLSFIGCTAEAGGAPAPDVRSDGSGGKSDETLAALPATVRIRNDLSEPVLVELGDAALWSLWNGGSPGDGAVLVEAYATSDTLPFEPHYEAVVVFTVDGTPLDWESVAGIGAIQTGNAGETELLIVVGGGPEAIASHEDYLPVELEAEPDPDTESDASFVSANSSLERVSEYYEGDGRGYSTTKCTVIGWTTDSDLRGGMKIEARDAAWANHKASETYRLREQGCHALGGNLYISEEDCSYRPEDEGVIFGGTRARASCTFKYRCLRRK